MLFTSLAFAIFLPIVFLVYYSCPVKYRYLVLLAASYYFYAGFGVAFLGVLIALTGGTYLAGIGIFQLRKKEKMKRAQFVFGAFLFLVIGLLFSFKYLSFTIAQVTGLISRFVITMDPLTLKIVVPAGLSFYSFKSISYVADIYREKRLPEKNIGHFALYLAFFPDLVSGPINRADHILPQIAKKKPFSYELAVYGLRLILLGFIKKLLIADTLAKYVNPIFDQVENYRGITLFVAAILYTIEIYCDFSGYSDIAIGVAKLFGIDFVANFKSPYFATNIKKFWDGWHISLSTWLRDYVYFPLGGSRGSKGKTYRNLFITFLISGIWHGANWTFFLWGIIHGVYQVIYRVLVDLRNKWYKNKAVLKPQNKFLSCFKTIASVLITDLFVTFAWIFFRANHISDAIYICRHMFESFSFYWLKIDFAMTNLDLATLGFFIPCLFFYDYVSTKKDVILMMNKWLLPIRWSIYLVLVSMLIVLYLHGGTGQSFIYFKF